MHKAWKEIITSEKTIWWGFLVLLIALLLPMLAVGTCAVPAADDYGFSATAHQAYESTGSVLAAVYTAGTKAVEHWFGWQGTFSAIFFMALQPAVFSEELYFLTTVIMLLCLVVGSLLFARAFFGELLGLGKRSCDIIAFAVCIPATQLLPSPVQGFFWFNGSVYYVAFYGFMLAALALGIGLVKKGGRRRSVLLCLLMFIIGGGNYVTALISCVLWFFSLALLLYQKNKAWKKLVLPGLFLFASFALSVAAPGNAVRMAVSPGGVGAVEAVLQSFRCGISYGLQWISLPVVSLMVFLAIVLRPALASGGFAYRYPGLVSAFSYCIISAMFCPPIFAMGNEGDDRLKNIIYFTWLLILAINLVWWMGWYYSRRKTGDKVRRLKLPALALGAALLAVCWGIGAVHGEGYTSLQAIGSLSSGEAQEFKACARRRDAVLNDKSVKNALIESFPCQPYLLYFSDIWADPEGWENIVMAEFYDKETVALK